MWLAQQRVPRIWKQCKQVRIHPESAQELNQILGPFWSVYKSESPQDLKKKCKQIRINPESAQEVYQILGSVWFVYTFLKSWELSVV